MNKISTALSIGLVMLFMLPLSMNAQMIFVSDAVNLKGSNASFQILGRYDDRYVIFSTADGAGELRHFNERMTEIGVFDIHTPLQRVDFKATVPRDSTFMIFYAARSGNQQQVFMNEFYLTGAIKDTALIRTTPADISPGAIDLIWSADRSQVLIWQRGDRGSINGTLYSVTDKQVVWEGTVNPSLLSLDRRVHDIILTAGARLYVVMDVEERRFRRQSGNLEVYVYNFLTEELQQVTVEMDEYSIYDVKFAYDHYNDRLVAGGLYAERRPVNASGFFYLSIEPGSLSYTLSFTPLDQQFLSSLYGKPQDQNMRLTDIAVQDVVLRFDGGLLLIVEQQKRFSRRSSSAMGRYYTGRDLLHVDYYYDDIIVLSIHPSGEVYWSEILRKRQYSQDDDAMYSSYFLLRSPESLRFVYNDEIKVNGLISEYVVSANGDARRRALPAITQPNSLLNLRSGVQTDVNEFVTLSLVRNQMRLVRFVF